MRRGNVAPLCKLVLSNFVFQSYWMNGGWLARAIPHLFIWLSAGVFVSGLFTVGKFIFKSDSLHHSSRFHTFLIIVAKWKVYRFLAFPASFAAHKMPCDRRPPTKMKLNLIVWRHNDKSNLPAFELKLITFFFLSLAKRRRLMFDRRDGNERSTKQFHFKVGDRKKRSVQPFLLCYKHRHQFIKCFSVCIICVRVARTKGATHNWKKRGQRKRAMGNGFCHFWSMKKIDEQKKSTNGVWRPFRKKPQKKKRQSTNNELS